MYDELNNYAKEYFLVWLNNNIKDDNILTRCIKEIDLLYDKKLLFIIEILYKYKKIDESVNYHFRGMANNLLILYVLGISKVDPIKYNLPYELFTEKTFSIDFINVSSLDFISFVESNEKNFRMIKGSFEPYDIDEINEIADNHYIIIPSYVTPNNMTFRLNNFNQFETVEDYHLFTKEYIVIRLDDKMLIQQNEVDIKYAMHSKFEENVAKIIKPKTINDYAKVISLAHGTNVWNDNQDKLFKDKLIDIENVIATREDVYEYLINHSIEHPVALEIVKHINKSRIKLNDSVWNNYINIMKEHNCSELFISILSRILFIFGRGQAISECLYALDLENYYME